MSNINPSYWYLSIPIGHPEGNLIKRTLEESRINYRQIRETESGFIELFSGLQSFVGTEQILNFISRSEY